MGEKSKQKTRKLTDIEVIFVEEYLVDLNATRAAKAAGYSEKSARQLASRLLSKVYIQDAISQAKAERIKRTQITADFTLKRLAWLADANIKHVAKWGSRTRKFTPEEGEPFEEETPFMDLMDSDVLSKGRAYGIDSIKVTAGEFGPNLSIKMRSPIQALDLLGQHQGIFEGGPKDNIPDALRDANRELDAADEGSEKKTEEA